MPANAVDRAGKRYMAAFKSTKCARGKLLLLLDVIIDSYRKNEAFRSGGGSLFYHFWECLILIFKNPCAGGIPWPGLILCR